jgi:hypothetical protein
MPARYRPGNLSRRLKGKGVNKKGTASHRKRPVSLPFLSNYGIQYPCAFCAFLWLERKNHEGIFEKPIGSE